MNTTKHGVRGLLASAAAGALLLGSAGIAAADTALVATSPAPVVKVQKVDIHRHSPVNLDRNGKIKLRLTVRATDPASVTAATVTLGQYLNRFQVAPNGTFTTTATLTSRVVKGHEVRLKGVVEASSLAGLALQDGQSATLCVSDVVTTPTAANAWSWQTQKRLAMTGVKKPVRECVKIYNPKPKTKHHNPHH